MSKYIKLEDAIHNINLEVIGRKEYTGDMKANLFFALDDLPTIEIVHCKDCKHLSKSQWVTNLDGTEKRYKCDCIGEFMLEDNFCSYGERIER